jgi:hypothetical protein
VQFDCIASFFFDSYFKNIAICIGKPLACFLQGDIDWRCSKKLATYCSCFQAELKQTKKEQGFLPPLKGSVSTLSLR